MDQPKLNLPVTVAPPLAVKPLHIPVSSISTGIEASSHIDRMIHASMGNLTAGLSPASIGLAFDDWFRHLAISPAKWARLTEKASRNLWRFYQYATRATVDPDVKPCINPLPQDRRFDAAGWRYWPFNVIHQGFLLQQQWWHNVTTGIGGVSPHHEQVVSFVTRQLLDMASPVNFIATNPEVFGATVNEGGTNLWRGLMNLLED